MRKELVLSSALILVSVLGCSRFTDLANSTASPADTNAANTNAANVSEAQPSGEFSPTSDAKADIRRMGERLLSQKSYRATIESEGVTPMNGVLEYAAPDRFRIQFETGMETIIIGNTTYIRVGGSWRKMPVALDSPIADLKSAFDEESMKWFEGVRYVGVETVDGRPSYAYAYNTKLPKYGGGDIDSKLWVAIDNGLPLKVEADYRSGELKKMRITYDHSTPVSIEPPIK
ncbi:MAG TPA: hypothetical protein PKD26_13920 [Pyrinomonadaceae bacterium]|nr:hypothetical protein [Pyrinomonadaceae bacterium]